MNRKGCPMKNNRIFVIMVIILLMTTGCTRNAEDTPGSARPTHTDSAGANATGDVPSKTKKQDWIVVGTIDHDTSSFTQGFEFIDADVIAESTGLYGQSSIQLISASNGAILQKKMLPETLFAEGLTVVDGKVIQLTWRNRTLISWSANSQHGIEPLAVHNDAYPGEGWGMCYDKTRNLIWRSDGTANLISHDPSTFTQRDKTPVTMDKQPLSELNELECIDGKVWANVWQSNTIVIIDPNTGVVESQLDLNEIVMDAQKANGRPFDTNQVLNGIARNPANGYIYVTGKQWPKTYIIKTKGV